MRLETYLGDSTCNHMSNKKKSKFSLERSKLEDLWDQMAEWEDFFKFECLKDLEDELGEMYLLTIPQNDAHNLILNNWQFKAQWSENSKTYKQYFKNLGKPDDDEITVIVYTEGWDYIADFTHSKDTLYINCFECGDEYTFEEMKVYEEEAYCEICSEYL